jgi:glycosyltransferase involved in cell wall biosynthesis
MEASLAVLAHRCQLARLRIERVAGRLFRWRDRPAVMATACWDFPIYSQTFVYQELTQLARRGFRLRFVYSKLNPRAHLPSQFSTIWHVRRRLLLHPAVCAREFAHYTARMPARVEALVAAVARVSGMSPDELRSHRHFQQAFAFTRLVEAYRPDYLHSYFFYEGSFFALCAGYLLDIPRGVSCYADHMLDDYDLKLVPLHLDLCAVVIATSARIKAELLSISPLADGTRILVKPNGINSLRFPAMGQSEPAAGMPFRIVCVSRIEPKKGHMYLIEAISLLRARNIQLEVHLLGGVDSNPASKEYADDVSARRAQLDLEGTVHFEGRKSEAEIRAFFDRSQLYVAPFVETESGDKDGIPTSLLEAMAAGMPVVATDAGSITEVIEHDRDGVIVPQRDARALADSIEALLADPVRRAALGREASAKIRNLFDVSTCERVFHDRVRTLGRARA